MGNDRSAAPLLKRGAPLSERRSMQLENKKIAILATNGFEQSELEVPRDKLKAAGGHRRYHFASSRRNQRMGQEGLGPARQGR